MAQITTEPVETIWNDGEFLLLRTPASSSRAGLVLAPAFEERAPISIARLKHAYELRNELDPSWAARPIELTSHKGQRALLIEDHGGE